MRRFFALTALVACLGCGPTVAVLEQGRAKASQPKVDSPLFPAKIDGLTGFIDEGGNVVIKPQWWDAGTFHDGLARVVDHGPAGSPFEIGFIDRTGKLVIPMRVCDDVAFDRDFHDGLVVYAEGDRYGYLDTSGKVAIKPQFYFHREHSADSCGCEYEGGPVQDFSEGFAFVQQGKRHYFIDKTGKRAFGRDFQEAKPFSDHIAAVFNGNGWGFIDDKGQWVIKPKYGGAGDFSEGVAPVEVANEEWIFIDRSGKQAIPGKFDGAEAFSEGKAVVYKPSSHASVSGLLDHTGNVVWLPEKWSAHSLHDGMARVDIDAQYVESSSYPGGSSTSTWNDNQIAYVDKDGKELFRLIGVDLKKSFFGQVAEDFHDGLLRVWSQEKNVRQGYVDRGGRWIWIESETSTPEPAAKPR